MEEMPPFKFEISYTELSLAIQVCYAIVANVDEKMLYMDYIIGKAEIKKIAKFLNNELRANEDKERFKVSFERMNSLHFDTILGLNSDTVEEHFTKEQNDLISDLFERYSNMLAEFWSKNFKR